VQSLVVNRAQRVPSWVVAGGRPWPRRSSLVVIVLISWAPSPLAFALHVPADRSAATALKGGLLLSGACRLQLRRLAHGLIGNSSPPTAAPPRLCQWRRAAPSGSPVRSRTQTFQLRASASVPPGLVQPSRRPTRTALRPSRVLKQRQRHLRAIAIGERPQRHIDDRGVRKMNPRRRPHPVAAIGAYSAYPSRVGTIRARSRRRREDDECKLGGALRCLLVALT
jgi:hypothetical protein